MLIDDLALALALPRTMVILCVSPVHLIAPQYEDKLVAVVEGEDS